MTSKDRSIRATGVEINDNKWHHIAASMPEDGCKLSEVRIYVDGQRVESTLTGTDCKLRFNQAVRMSIGGGGYSNKSFDRVPVKPFIGELDEIMVWVRPLMDKEVITLGK
jgi:hypothetical protein